MDDACQTTSLPDDIHQLKAMLAARDQALAVRDHRLAEYESAIARLTEQRDAFYLEKLRLEMRLAKALKQAYGPRADRLNDPGQLLLDFAQTLESLPVRRGDLPPEENTTEPATARRPASRRIRTRGRRDIGSLDNLPMVEKKYELTDELCRCPHCQRQRTRIGEQVSYTIEHVPATLLRVKHIQYKYACPHCEHNGDHPQIELAAKTGGSPIDRGMPGPGLLAYIATSKYADFLPLHRLQSIFERQGFELDRSTMCLWMADVARLARLIYDLMVRRVLLSHVLATDDTVMPLLQPGRTRQARMWIYLGDESQPYNVFHFTISRSRDGPQQFLRGSLVYYWPMPMADTTGSLWIRTSCAPAAGPMPAGSSSRPSRPPRTWPGRSCGRSIACSTSRPGPRACRTRIVWLCVRRSRGRSWMDCVPCSWSRRPACCPSTPWPRPWATR
jgi:transposase